MDEFMREAIEEAERGRAEGGIPIGSVLVHRGMIIDRGHNRHMRVALPRVEIMIKIAFILMLAILWSEAAFAVVYQCRDRKGNIFLTNDRSKFPPGCEQFGETFGEQPPPPPAVTPPVTPPVAPMRNEPGMSERRRSPAPPPSPAPQSTQDQSSQQEVKPATPATGTEPPDEEEQ